MTFKAVRPELSNCFVIPFIRDSLDKEISNLVKSGSLFVANRAHIISSFSREPPAIIGTKHSIIFFSSASRELYKKIFSFEIIKLKR